LKIEIDKSAGFCWGVVRAIDFAEQALNESEQLFSLGDIIHNTEEVNRLNARGLRTTKVENLDELPENAKLLIRAHGEPPSTYKKAAEKNITLIDATCPVVSKVQERIRKYADNDYQVVIFGKKDHAEVIGLIGVTLGNSIVVSSVEEALTNVKLNKPTVLFSQTTMDKATFYAIADALRKKIEHLEIGSIEETAIDFHAKDTICGQVSGRERKLQEFARSYDVIIFTAGKHSSNGKVLFQVAKNANPKTFFIESNNEIDWDWFRDVNSVGITGATSTPQWVMEEVQKLLIKKLN
jgi:4-hydroxy-3-methylbut-2-enyl diphosphate reductase